MKEQLPLSWLKILALLSLCILAGAQGFRRLEVARVGRPPAANDYPVFVVGDTIPDIRTRNGTNASVTLSSHLNSRCQVLVFFHPACPWCARLAQSRRDTVGVGDLPIRWVSMPGSRRESAAFVREYGLEEDWFMIDRWSDAAKLGVKSTPTTLLVGSDRVLLGQLPGDLPVISSACRGEGV